MTKMNTQMRWRLISAHNDSAASDAVPHGREPWGNVACHNGALYVFGGMFRRYGKPRGWSDLTRLGVANDFWRYNAEGWTRLEEDDDSREFSPAAHRPGTRFLAATHVVDDCLYIFGGATIFGPDWVGRAVNDLWRRRLPDGQWEQVHPDNGWCQFPGGPGKQPQIRVGLSSTVLGSSIYIFGGWSGTVPLIYANDLWRFDTVAESWDCCSRWQRDSASGYGLDATHPGRRFCPHVFAYHGDVFVFGGRDDSNRPGTLPRYFNDLWRFRVADNRWELLQPDDGTVGTPQADRPPGRYAAGQVAHDGTFYLYGGHNNSGDTELNDFWRCDLSSGAWTCIHTGSGGGVPSVRRAPALVSDGRSLFLFGGCDFFRGDRDTGGPLPLNDLWEYPL